MKTIKKLLLSLVIIFPLLVGCEPDTSSLNLAKLIKKDVPVFAELTTGQVSFDSVKAYYNDTAHKWQEILASEPPERFRKGIEAHKNIAVTLNTLFHGNTGQINMSYLGIANEENSDVVGIFFYDLTGTDFSLLTDQLFKDANGFTFASESGEYFHKVGNYVITCIHGLLEDYQSLFDKIDTMNIA